MMIKMVSALLLSLVMWQWGSACWIFAKAQLAQRLITSAWTDTLAQPQERIRPWPWADTWPIARLRFTNHDIDLYVLAGAEGNSLAFGPGHHQGSSLPGEGMSVIGGHRDTHFRFLQHIRTGDTLELQLPDGNFIRYQVDDTEVVNIYKQPLLIERERQGLLLVTCYPFNAINPDGPLRLLVWTSPVQSTARLINYSP